MPSRRWPLLASGSLVLVVIAAASMTILVVDIDLADKASSVVGAAVALGSAIMAVFWWLARSERMGDSLADVHARVLRDLAIVAEAQWRNEANRRGVFRPMPLRLRWSLTRRTIAALPEAVLAPAVGGRPLRWRVDVEDGRLSTLFERLPRRQLVVVGPPGSGKSTLAMLFTLDLLGKRSDGDPVPVLLTVTGLDRELSLGEWVAERLREQYPGVLPASRSATRDAVDGLFARGLLVAVLDGIDELGIDQSVTALTQLDDMFADRPYVLTCRDIDFADAVGRYGRPLAGAAVVEIEPVALADALAFLRPVSAWGVQGWEHLVQLLQHGKNGPLGRLLASPLWLTLFREVYGHGTRDPSELFEQGRSTEAMNIEEFLIDDLILQAYDSLRPTLRGGRSRPEPRWRAKQVRRWLTFLASVA